MTISSGVLGTIVMVAVAATFMALIVLLALWVKEWKGKSLW